MVSHPRLQRFRRWVLATKDAHGLYEKFGIHCAQAAGALDGAAGSERRGKSRLLEGELTA